jgi:hypothetical protein
VPAFLLCLHPIARDIGLGLLAALVLLGIAALLLHRRALSFALGACLVLAALAFGLGSYRLSPLGFGSARIPLLNSFRITQALRGQREIPLRQVVTVSRGSITGIEPQLLPGPATCMWASSNGGAFDDPASCDTAYSPGEGATFDILHVSVRSACGLPPALGEIRIGVLP